MTQAKSGDRVKVHYIGTLDDGNQFDSSRNREPLEFVIGDGRLIPGFEQAVLGMGTGESRLVNIPAAKAYGQPQRELVRSVSRTDIPDHIELSTGLVLNAQSPDGKVQHFTVVEFDERTVTLDGNHPLAGRDLTFEIELVEVVSVHGGV